jgi:hypothetical protein
MATEGKGPSESSKDSGGPTIAEAIREIAARNARAELDSEDQLKLFLQSWWSKIYNRPLKDPLLQTYTLEELLYEFYDKIERRAAEIERSESAEMQQEENKDKANLDWAEQMEREELEQLKAKAAAEEAARKQDPTKDPENIKWMEEQMRLAKTQFGESFGEDIEEKFDE